VSWPPELARTGSDTNRSAGSAGDHRRVIAEMRGVAAVRQRHTHDNIRPRRRRLPGICSTRQRSLQPPRRCLERRTTHGLRSGCGQRPHPQPRACDPVPARMNTGERPVVFRISEPERSSVIPALARYRPAAMPLETVSREQYPVLPFRPTRLRRPSRWAGESRARVG